MKIKALYEATKGILGALIVLLLMNIILWAYGALGLMILKDIVDYVVFIFAT